MISIVADVGSPTGLTNCWKCQLLQVPSRRWHRIRLQAGVEPLKDGRFVSEEPCFYQGQNDSQECSHQSRRHSSSEVMLLHSWLTSPQSTWCLSVSEVADHPRVMVGIDCLDPCEHQLLEKISRYRWNWKCLCEQKEEFGHKLKQAQSKKAIHNLADLDFRERPETDSFQRRGVFAQCLILANEGGMSHRNTTPILFWGEGEQN